MSNQTVYSERFFTISFTLSIVACSIGLLSGGLIILIVITNKRFYTIANLLTCNSSLCIVFYLTGILLANMYGFRDDWLYYQPACTFRAYFISMCCAIIAYSYLTQAISRLFFTVFYIRKNFHTFRIHFIMIILNWCISILIPCLTYFLDNNAAILVLKCRYCLVTPDSFKPSIFGMIMSFVIPFSLIIAIYTNILTYIRQSKRRVNPHNSISNTNINIKRELRLMKITIMLWSFFIIAGIPYFLLVLWPILFSTSAPYQLYIIGLNSITISCSCMNILTLFISTDIRAYLLNLIVH